MAVMVLLQIGWDVSWLVCADGCAFDLFCWRLFLWASEQEEELQLASLNGAGQVAASCHSASWG